MCLLLRSTEVRFSSSALLRLPINDLYVLILTPERGHAAYLGPIGGVLKYRPRECKKIFADMGISSYEERVAESPGDDVLNDLRIRMPRKSFLKFLKWYLTTEGREAPQNALRREIREEISADPLIPESVVRAAENCTFISAHISVKAFKTRSDQRLLHYRLFNVFDIADDEWAEKFIKEIQQLLEEDQTSVTSASKTEIFEGLGRVSRDGVRSVVNIGAHSISMFKKHLHKEREDEAVGRAEK